MKNILITLLLVSFLAVPFTTYAAGPDLGCILSLGLICPNSGGGGGFGGGGYYGGSSGGGWSMGNVASFGLPSGSISDIIRNLLLWVLMIFGMIGIIGFVISGIMYILAAGDDELMKKAKNAMKWSIIGVVVGLIGVVIIQAIDLALRGISGF